MELSEGEKIIQEAIRRKKEDEKQDSEAVSPSGGKAGHLVCTSRV